MAEMNWTVKLTDNMSGPAKKAASGLQGIGDAAGSIEAAMKSATGGVQALQAALNRIKAPSLAGVAMAAQGMRLAEIQKQTDKLTANYKASRLDRAMSQDSRLMELWGQKKGSSEWWAKSSDKGVGPGPSVFSKLIGGANRLSPGLGQKLLGGASKLAGWDEKLQGYGLSLEGVGKAGMGAVAVGAAAAVAAVMAVGAAVGALVVGLGSLAIKGAQAFSQMTIKTGMFRENTLLTFEVLLKNKQAAEDLYESATKVAKQTPLETDQVIGAYRDLLSRGFGSGEIEKYVRSLSDFSSAMGADKFQPALEALGKVKNAGKLTGEALESLVAAGLPLPELIAKLGGKTKDDILGVDSAKALAAILEVINDRYGGLSEKKSQTLEGLWSTVSSAPGDLFNAAFKQKGGLQGFYDSMKGVVDWMAKVFDPDSATGKRVVGLIDRIGGGFGSLFKDFDGNKLTGVFGGILTVFETVMPYFESFMKGLGKGFGDKLAPLGKLLQDLTGKPETVEAIAAAFGKIGEFIGSSGALLIDFVGRIAVAIVYINQLAAKVESAWNAITSFFSNIGGNIKAAISGISLFGEGSSIGMSLIDGLVAGISGGVSAVAGAAAGAAAAAISGARSRDGADVHSPSKKMAAVGGFMSEGLSQGIESKASLVTSTMVDTVAAPIETTASVASAPMASASGRAGATVTIQSLVIQAQDAADVERQLSGIFERVSLQLQGA